MCRENSRNSIYVFEEQKSKLTLLNSNKVLSTRIHVDGCEITTGIRCDYMHIAKGIEMYIELKGQDIGHAIKQIERSILLLSSDTKKISKTTYVICTRSPLVTTEIQKYARKLKENYNANLVVRSSPYKDKY